MLSAGVASGPVTVGAHAVPVSVTVGAVCGVDRSLDALIQSADDLLRSNKGSRRPGASNQPVVLFG